MKKYLISQEGNFYRANLHCHTTVSDGKKTPEEVKEIYKARGYSIVAYTDHDVLVGHEDLCDGEFLALHGYEMEASETENIPSYKKKTAHMCLIALAPDNLKQVCYHREKYMIGHGGEYRDKLCFDESLPDYVRAHTSECVSDMMRQGRENGFFVTYNHPTWSLEDYSDYMGYHGMHAMEIYNGSCISSGYEDINPRVYDDMLRGGERIFCIGADDNHNAHPEDSRRFDSGVAYTVIKAPSLEYTAVTDALVRGDFYASMGPEIKELYVEDGRVYIKTSPADRIQIHYGNRRSDVVYRESGRSLTKADFKIHDDCGYIRLTVIDRRGQRADTNAYFTDGMFDDN